MYWKGEASVGFLKGNLLLVSTFSVLVFLAKFFANTDFLSGEFNVDVEIPGEIGEFLYENLVILLLVDGLIVFWVIVLYLNSGVLHPLDFRIICDFSFLFLEKIEPILLKNSTISNPVESA